MQGTLSLTKVLQAPIYFGEQSLEFRPQFRVQSDTIHVYIDSCRVGTTLTLLAVGEATVRVSVTEPIGGGRFWYQNPNGHISRSNLNNTDDPPTHPHYTINVPPCGDANGIVEMKNNACQRLPKITK
jgi:hypothetical protein